MKVIQRLKFLLLILLSLVTFNLISVYLSINTMTHDGRTVNYAGIVRGNTQRMIKLRLLSENVNSVIIDIDAILQGLQNGSSDLNLKKISNPDFQASLIPLERQWINLKRIAQNSSIEDQSRLLEESEIFWRLSNRTVRLSEENALLNVRNSQRLAGGLFMVNLIVLAGLWKITQSIAKALQQSVDNISMSSTEIAITIEEQERMTNQYAISMDQTKVSVDELKQSSQTSVKQAKMASQQAQSISNLSQVGCDNTQNTLLQFSLLQEKFEEMSQEFFNFKEQATQITSITDFVSQIAAQTNMLALNASIEASRAGKQGREFSVVASEIRKLANNSKQSASKIDKIVDDIQMAVARTVRVSEEGQDLLRNSISIVNQSSQSFNQVAEEVDDINSSLSEIVLECQQQSIATQQIFSIMEDLNNAAQETAIGIQQTRKEIYELDNTVKILKFMI